ncbi:alanine:cation symporter family protein [Shigella flexneri]
MAGSADGAAVGVHQPVGVRHTSTRCRTLSPPFSSAFGWRGEAASGATGSTVSGGRSPAGFQRGILATEAGMGSTPNAAAAAWILARIRRAGHCADDWRSSQTPLLSVSPAR